MITIAIVSNYQVAILLLIMLQETNENETIQASIMRNQVVVSWKVAEENMLRLYWSVTYLGNLFFSKFLALRHD